MLTETEIDTAAHEFLRRMAAKLEHAEPKPIESHPIEESGIMWDVIVEEEFLMSI